MVRAGRIAGLAVGLAALCFGEPARAQDREPDPFEGRREDEPPPLSLDDEDIGVPALDPAMEERDGPRDDAAGDEAPAPRRRRRPRAPYEEDAVSPFARNDLALAGSIVLGSGYFMPLFVLGPQGFPKGTAPMLAPVAGPWITLAVREDDGTKNETGKRAYIVADGVIQGAGALMLLIGQLLPVTDPMASEGESWAVVPSGPGGPGASAYGSF